MTGRTTVRPDDRPWDYSAETGVRATDEWQDAHRRYIAPCGDSEDPDAVYARQIRAAVDMWRIEKTEQAQ
jgi:hypothetical protein